jgi:hypothetical protein
MFWFFDFHGDAAQLPTCYFSFALTLGFVASEAEFRFVDVLSNTIAEIRSGDA